VRGKHNKLVEGERKVRLDQDSLPNRENPRGKITESSGNYIRCFIRTHITLCEGAWPTVQKEFVKENFFQIYYIKFCLSAKIMNQHL
jgi:hypothetical protein